MVNTDQAFLMKPSATDHTQYFKISNCEAEIFYTGRKSLDRACSVVQNKDQNEIIKEKEKHFHPFFKKQLCYEFETIVSKEMEINLKVQW